MAWITEIPRKEATGLLREELDAAVRRSGRVWNIVQVMSIHVASPVGESRLQSERVWSRDAA